MSDMNSFNNPAEANLPVKPKRRSVKRNIIIVSLVVLFVVGGIASLGFARGFYDNHRGGKHGGPLGFLMDVAVKDLDLNDQQKKEVDNIKSEIKAKMESKKDSRKNDMDEMINMFRSDNFDKTKALDMMKQHDADRDEMRSFMLDETAKFHAVLTPDQRNKLADKVKEFRSKKDEMRKKFERDKE